MIGHHRRAGWGQCLVPHGAVHNLAAQRAELAHRRLAQRLHLVVPAVLDQQNPFSLAQWPDNLAGEPQHGRLGGGAGAHHQRPAALAQPIHHLPMRGIRTHAP